jgi:DNA polymerase III alpha subunit
MKEALKIVEGKNEDVANEVSDSIPKKFGKVIEFEEAEKESSQFLSFTKSYPRAYKIAKKLDGLVKNSGVHPSGIAICNDLLENTMPFSRTKDGDLVSGFDMGDVAAVAIKFDILGLRTLTVLDKVYKMTGIKPEEIPMDDQEVFKFLQNLTAPQGIFQIETDTGFRVCQKVKPKNIYDLSAVLALARPGALAFVDQYARYSTTGEIKSVEPFFDDVLAFTASIPLYQEELIACARKIGFSADEGEMLRRSVAKKKPEEMSKWKLKIEEKIKENNLNPSIGDFLWKLAEDSAGYSFNFSHSLAYATCSYRTVYAKVHYPKEFYLALLQMAQNEPDPFEEISKITPELALFNIKLLPPDLAKSQKDFSIEGENLRFGLQAIKGISEKSIDSLIEFRGKEASNKYEIFTNAKDCGLSIAVLCSLIQAGCLDSISKDRPLTILEAQLFNKLTPNEKKAIIECGESHNYNIFEGLREAAAGRIFNDKGKPAFSEKRLNTLRVEHQELKKIYDQNVKHHKLCNWYFERKLLGYSYSYNLREVFEESQKNFTPILEIQSVEDNEFVKIVGVVGETKRAKSKKNGMPYMSIEVSDETAKITALFMDNQREAKFTKYAETKTLPKTDDIIVFIDKLEIMTEKIALKMKDLKN